MHNSIIKLSTSPAGFEDSTEPLTAEMFSSAIPIQHSHDFYTDEELGLYVGVWDTTEMKEAPGPYELEEFMVIIEGQAEIRNNQTGTLETVEAGESFVIPKGYNCQWKQQGYLKKFYLILDNDKLAGNNQNVTAISRFTPQQTSAIYANEQQTFVSGVSSSAINILANNAYRFFYVIAGQISLIDDGGNKHTFNANDAGFLPQHCEIACTISDDYQCYFTNINI